MTPAFLSTAIDAAQAMLVLAMLVAGVSIFRGPRAQDRIVAFDALYGSATLLFLVLGLRTGSLLYATMALIIAVMGFVSTLALAKFLLDGEVIE